MFSNEVFLVRGVERELLWVSAILRGERMIHSVLVVLHQVMERKLHRVLVVLRGEKTIHSVLVVVLHRVVELKLLRLSVELHDANHLLLLSKML